MAIVMVLLIPVHVVFIPALSGPVYAPPKTFEPPVRWHA